MGFVLRFCSLSFLGLWSAAAVCLLLRRLQLDDLCQWRENSVGGARPVVQNLRCALLLGIQPVAAATGKDGTRTGTPGKCSTRPSRQALCFARIALTWGSGAFA